MASSPWTTNAALAAATAKLPALMMSGGLTGKLSKKENPYQPTWGSPEIERRSRGVVEKCTFCSHRIDRGLAQGLTPGVDREATPACVNICPVNARVFGDHNDPESPVSIFVKDNETFRLREDFGTKPNVHYVRPEKEEV